MFDRARKPGPETNFLQTGWEFRGVNISIEAVAEYQCFQPCGPVDEFDGLVELLPEGQSLQGLGPVAVEIFGIPIAAQG